MISRLAQLVPTPVIRFAVRLMNRVPALRPSFERLAGAIAAGEGTIQRGIGRGLRFHADVDVAGYRLGTTEPEFQDALASRIRAGMVVYDLGANVGFYSVICARLVGRTGRVVAVEPFPESAEIVRHNARLNGFDIDVLEAAIGEEVGTAWLRTDYGGPVTFRLDDSRAGDGLEVALTTVDAMVESGYPPPDLIKVDVEGVEVAALHGMTKTLKDHRPIVLVEVHHAVADFPEAVEAIATPLGYRTSVLEGGPMPRGGVRAHVALDPA